MTKQEIDNKELSVRQMKTLIKKIDNESKEPLNLNPKQILFFLTDKSIRSLLFENYALRNELKKKREKTKRLQLKKEQQNA